MTTLSGQGSIKGKHRFFSIAPISWYQDVVSGHGAMGKANQTFEGSHMGRLATLTDLVLGLPAVDVIAGTEQVRSELPQPEGR